MMISQTGNSRRRTDCSAFTFIEIILVVIFLAVIAALILPGFSQTFKKMRLRSTAEELCLFMKYAQTRAVTNGQIVRLSVDAETRRYWIEDVVPSGTQSDQNENYEPVSGRWGRVFSVFPEMEVTAENPFIKFYPDGHIDQDEIRICFEGKCKIVSTKSRWGKALIYDAEESEKN